MKTSDRGVRLIQEFEGFRAKPYQDEAGVWTIGYGHTQKVTQDYLPITEAEGRALLVQDLLQAETAVNRFCPCHLAQNEFDALVSFTFNLGPGRLLTSTLLKLLLHGDKLGAGKEFFRWIHCRDPITGELTVSRTLEKRRATEAKVFLVGYSGLGFS